MKFSHQLRFLPADHDALLEHLYSGKVEQVAFGFASWKCSPEGTILAVEQVRAVAASELAHQSAYHVQLDERAQADVIHAGFESGQALVEFHSHRSRNPACFSASDRAGFVEFVPHVQWRLPGRPYAAVVWHEGNFDGLIWAPNCRTPAQLSIITIEGRGVLEATCRTLTEDNRHDRRAL